MTLGSDLALAARTFDEAENLLSAALPAHVQAAVVLARAIQQAVDGHVNTLQPEAFPVSDHRRIHRPGRAPKIDSDPDLQAFIAARIDRMTFIQIAADVTEHFPPERRVGKSAIHKWWQDNKSRRASSADKN